MNNLPTVTIPYYNPSNNPIITQLSNDCQKDYDECIQKLNQVKTNGELSDAEFDIEKKM